MSFLAHVAKSKIFDLTGFDSVDSAKQAQLYKVLVWASEEKEREDLIAAHYEQLNK